MVTVIGDAPEAKRRTICRRCAIELEYTEGEVKEYHGKDYSGGPDGHQWIDCPKCGQKIILKSW